MFIKPSPYFIKVFNNSERIEFTDQLNKLIDLELETDEVVSLYDFKNRRVIVFGSNFGNIILVEEQGTVGVTYFVNYDRNSPVSQMLPYRSIDERDLLYICGSSDEDDEPNISERIDMMLQKLQDYLNQTN